MTRLYLSAFDTPFGIIRTAATETALAIVGLPNQTEETFERLVQDCFPGCTLARGGEINREAEVQLSGYLQGQLRVFALSLEGYGTPFEQKVHRAVAAIPYGEVRSYGEIARSVGHPRAFRAVGSVNARNRLPLVIPCHRVVATGGLGGYGGGLDMKKRLLTMEGAHRDNLAGWLGASSTMHSNGDR